jgi:hypothetical protein
MKSKIEIRDYHLEDAKALMDIFYNTIGLFHLFAHKPILSHQLIL